MAEENLDQSVNKLVRQAREELDAGNRDDALDLLKQALTLDPQSNAVTSAILEMEKKPRSAAPEKTQPPQEEKPRAKARKKAPAEKPKPSKQPTRPSPKEAKTEQPAPKRGPQPKKKAPKTVPPKSDKEKFNEQLEASDRAIAAGDADGAMSALKKAKKLDPSSPEVDIRIQKLKDILKAAKAVSMGIDALESGAIAKAIRFARIAFSLDPDTEQLPDLVSRIESEGSPAPAPTPEQPPEKSAEPKQKAAGKDPARYIQDIREKVQISSFPEAARITREAMRKYPDHELLLTFATKFKKMGLMDEED